MVPPGIMVLQTAIALLSSIGGMVNNRVPGFK